MTDKIRTEHLERCAMVYVRQSTSYQVRNHHEGRQRQYDLATRARELGFSKTTVIDEDQGRSGSGLVERPGFAQLLATVCAGEAGAVFALEASRLARNNRDWHHLIDLCAMTETLIIDHDGTYDPRHLNDRLLLGLKGSMAEFELSLMRQRARESFEKKVGRGHALWQLPVGFVRNEHDRVEKIADRQVQQAIEGVFEKFRQLGSAAQTTMWYWDQQVPLPLAVSGTGGREITWQLPTANRVRQMLRNPCYAGALAYGKTFVRTVVENGRPRKTSTQKRKPRDQWKVLILDNHPGYITWEDYLENLKILESNMARSHASRPGAARRGTALLAGLLRCGHCGRKMFVRYRGTSGRLPAYACCGGRTDRGRVACQSFGGLSVDRAVSEQVLAAIQPAGIRAALAAMDQAVERHAEKREALKLALEKARYETQRAHRQYDKADPENRLVAGELESRWNAALEKVAQLEEQLQQLQRERTTLSDDQKQRILELGSDLSSLWSHNAASEELKKRILRTVLREITVNDNRDPNEHHLVLHWQGGVHTELRVPRNLPGKHRKRTDKTANELIAELSKVCSDQAIAATLNRLGFVTGSGKSWRVHSVHHCRWYYKLPNYQNSGQWLTVEQASRELGVSQTVIRRLIKQKTLPATQIVERAPWIIDRDDLSLRDVQVEIEAVRQGRQLRGSPPNQQELPLK